jgi:ATP-binding cassette, subfamily B, bacterial
VGSHAELLARGGQYAELYGIQAAAYRDRRPDPWPAGPAGPTG